MNSLENIVDTEGYLIDPENWNEPLAEILAKEEKIELNEESWVILRFIRDYYAEHRIIPDIRHVVKYFSEHLKCDKHTAKNRLFELFPYGYVKQTCKSAGMKRPRAWSTG
jgi:tRNA 2-thiouridine synthesizing protein E